jgi:hypothetical protein
MVEHISHEPNESDEENFYPVDGIRGECKCGEYFHYIAFEGEIECDCGRTWNVFVQSEEQ